MKAKKNLKLNKETISRLNNLDDIKGGAQYFTGGCTDGCSAWKHTELWNCSEDNCTNDCTNCGDPTWTGTNRCPQK